MHIFLKSSGLIADKNIDLAANDDITIKKLLLGRVDLIYTAEDSIKERLRINGFTMDVVKVAYQSPDYKGKPLCLALNKNSSKDLVNALREAHKKVLN